LGEKADVNLGVQSRREQGSSADLSLGKEDVHGRHMPGRPVGGDFHSVLAQAIDKAALAEVKRTGPMQLSQDYVHHGI
jgi:hypothetical protein